jgi:hypothetical protein
MVSIGSSWLAYKPHFLAVETRFVDKWETQYARLYSASSASNLAASTHSPRPRYETQQVSFYEKGYSCPSNQALCHSLSRLPHRRHVMPEQPQHIRCALHDIAPRPVNALFHCVFAPWREKSKKFGSREAAKARRIPSLRGASRRRNPVARVRIGLLRCALNDVSAAITPSAPNRHGQNRRLYKAMAPRSPPLAHRQNNRQS